MPVNDKKRAYFERLVDLMETYTKFFLVHIDHVSSKQIQAIRIALRGEGIVLFGKNTMIRRCMTIYCDEHPESPLKNVIELIRGNIGIVFVREDLNAVREVIIANKVPAPARVGVIANDNVIVPAGPTGCEPGMTSFFQALDIATKISRGQIEIENPVLLVRPGEKVTPGQVALLSKLDIKPFTYGMVITNVYDEGSLYDPKVLDLSEADILAKFYAAVRKLAAASLALGYPTLASLPHSLNNGFKLLLSVVVNDEVDYTFEKAQPFLDYLADPSAFAVAAPAATEEGAAAAVEEEEEEEEESADAGVGGLFGSDDDDSDW